MTKNEAINILVKCANLYKENLEGKSLLIFFLDNDKKVDYIEIIFSKSNFQHLTGIEHTNKNEVNSFYDRCIHKVISAKEIKFKRDGTTELKLLALEQLMHINKNARMIGEYNFSKTYLYTDRVVGGVFATLGIKKVNNYYVANTALKEDIRNITNKTNRIFCIMEKHVTEELYENITYLAKGVNIDEIINSKDIIKKVRIKKV